MSEDLSLLDGTITGLAVRPAEPTSKPLLVFVHGGGANARGFDVPGRSQLRRAALNGFPAFALNRPGYGGSASLDFAPDSEDGLFAATAERLDDAIAELWSRHAGDAPGVVVNGVSIGGAIALHLAARWGGQAEPRWPLIGLATSDIAQVPPDDIVAAWHSSAVEERVDLFSLMDRITMPPLWTMGARLDPGALPGVFEPAVRAEVLEVVGGWTRDWAKVAASVTVPVHHRLAEHDTFWIPSPALLADFTRELRTRSPYVDAALFPGAGHGIADSVAGAEYPFQVLGFAERCAAAVTTPRLLG